MIAHTKALDPSRPVTFVTDANYALDHGVSLLGFLAFSFFHFLNSYITFPCHLFYTPFPPLLSNLLEIFSRERLKKNYIFISSRNHLIL